MEEKRARKRYFWDWRKKLKKKEEREKRWNEIWEAEKEDLFTIEVSFLANLNLQSSLNILNQELILPNFFLRKRRYFLFFFAIKLGRFIANALFYYVTNT